MPHLIAYSVSVVIDITISEGIILSSATYLFFCFRSSAFRKVYYMYRNPIYSPLVHESEADYFSLFVFLIVRVFFKISAVHCNELIIYKLMQLK